MLRYETRFIKYITDKEAIITLNKVKQRESKSFELCFKMCAFVGLRISDSINLKTENFKSDYHRVVYQDKKTKFSQDRAIPEFLAIKLKEYYNKEKKNIKKHKNYFFPPQRASKNDHLMSGTFRHFFNDIRKKGLLDEHYYKRKDGKQMHRISMHTFKHFAAFKVYKSSGNDFAFTQNYFNHQEAKHTLRYIMGFETKERSREVVDNAFLGCLAET